MTARIVRTPTRATGGITPEEKTRLDEHAKLWIARAFRTDQIEPDKIVPAIEDLYAAAGLKKPRVIIVPSPLVMAFAYGASAAIIYQRKNGSVATATASATDSATASATASAISGAALACYDIAGHFGLLCANRWGNAYQGGNTWAPYDCFLTGMRDIIGLRLSEHDKYEPWERSAINGGFRVLHEDFCMVSDFPEFIRVDEQNRPHCETGPSHRWRDGWSIYYWHGVAIPGEWIEDRASLSPQIALTWKNIEQRRCACEILGWSTILGALKAKTIDKDCDAEIGELVEVKIPDIGKERFLRVQCGTGRQFALPVPPTMKTALQANAWTFGYDDHHDFTKPEIRT